MKFVRSPTVSTDLQVTSEPPLSSNPALYKFGVTPAWLSP